MAMQKLEPRATSRKPITFFYKLTHSEDETEKHGICLHMLCFFYSSYLEFLWHGSGFRFLIALVVGRVKRLSKNQNLTRSLNELELFFTEEHEA